MNEHTEEVLLDHINAAVPDDADPVLARLTALEQKLSELTAQNAALQQEIKTAATTTHNNSELETRNLSRFAGVSGAGARRRNPEERSDEGSVHAGAESLRKTLPPSMCALLAKTAESTTLDAAGHFDAAALDQALASLSVEQRIAVKAEMARAGLIA